MLFHQNPTGNRRVGNSEPPRKPRCFTFLSPTQVGELYAGGLTLMEVGLRLGVSQQMVRQALNSEGVTIRPGGRRAGVNA